MSGDGVEPGADAILPRPSGASDVVPVRIGAPPTGRGGVHPVPTGLAGSSIVASDQPWHPGLDLPSVGGAHQPMWDHSGDRYRKSVVTFGPVGRILLTTATLGMVLLLLTSGVLYLFPLVPLMFFLVPVLRDVWKKAPVSSPTPPGAASAAARSQSGLPR
jgi:hypothetical protein